MVPPLDELTAFEGGASAAGGGSREDKERMMTAFTLWAEVA